MLELGLQTWAVRVLDTDASFSLGIHIYCKKAALCHLPSVCIVESSTPANAAEVAAPILKLWPTYWCCGSPSDARIPLISPTNHAFVIVLPLVSMKKGPGLDPHSTMKVTIAATGQRGLSVRPRMMSAPMPNWSHLDFLRWIFTFVGSV